jgi:hypothetical protein
MQTPITLTREGSDNSAFRRERAVSLCDQHSVGTNAQHAFFVTSIRTAGPTAAISTVHVLQKLRLFGFSGSTQSTEGTAIHV